MLRYYHYRKLSSNAQNAYANYKIHVFTELKEVIEMGSDDGGYLEPEHYRALYEERGSILHELYDDFLGEEYASVNGA